MFKVMSDTISTKFCDFYVFLDAKKIIFSPKIFNQVHTQSLPRHRCDLPSFSRQGLKGPALTKRPLSLHEVFFWLCMLFEKISSQLTPLCRLRLHLC